MASFHVTVEDCPEDDYCSDSTETLPYHSPFILEEITIQNDVASHTHIGT